MIRLALIGCGAVTQRNHAPALRAVPAVRVTHLVDVDPAMTAALAERAGYSDVLHLTAADTLPGAVDAALLAVPHHLHETLAVPLLEAGVHVFVEKPMALTSASCDRMLAAAGRGGASLAVGLARRFLPSYRWVRGALQDGLLGTLRRFVVEEGGPYSWPLRSGFMFDREQAGGGVLFDVGAHVVDALLWWLGDLEVTQARDDARGGVEADVTIDLRTADGVPGVLRLSRLRALSNAATLVGDRGELEVGLLDGRITWRRPGAPALEATVEGARGLAAIFEEQLASWIDALDAGRAPPIDGVAGRRSVAWIEACYARRTAAPLEAFERAPSAGEAS